MVWSVVAEIDYFAYLILIGEIKDEVVLGYYRPRLSEYIEVIIRHYTPADNRWNLSEEYRDFDRLIRRWNINVPDEET